MALQDEYGLAPRGGLIASGNVPVSPVDGAGLLGPLYNNVMRGVTNVAKQYEIPAVINRYERAMNPQSDMSKMERLMNIFPAADALAGGLLTGARVPANALASGALRRQADMPAGSTANPDYTVPAGGDPRYLGAAPNRTEYDYPRYTPKKNRPRTQRALDSIRSNRNGVKDALIADIKKGEELGGSSWYNTEELRDWFIASKGPEKGNEEWMEYMNLMGATSSGNKVPTNMGVASYYRSRGPEWIRENYDALKAMNKDSPESLKPPKGYGHKMQSNHAMNAARLMNKEWTPSVEGSVKHGNWTQNPKPKGFANSLLGSEKNIAADLHFTRYMAMADGSPEWLSTSAEISDALYNTLATKYGAKNINKYITAPGKGKEGKPKFNAKKAVSEGAVDFDDLRREPTVLEGKPSDNEYAAFEEAINEIGAEMGMTGPQVQANLWMGAADRTGVDPSSQGTFMELFRKRAAETGRKTGKTQQEVISNFINNRGLLSAGVPVTAPLMAAQDNYVPTAPNQFPNYMPPQAPELDANPARLLRGLLPNEA